jgi:hypothetical protein
MGPALARVALTAVRINHGVVILVATTQPAAAVVLAFS